MEKKMRYANFALILSALMVVMSPAAAQVKVGVLTDMDSIYADISGKGAVASAQMAAEDFGPVLGGPVEIVSANHQNSPDVASGIARRWYDAEGVDMITDGGSSAVALAVENISRQKQKLVRAIAVATSGLFS
jgi:branched-chain amino acid transport system substrate-binding protein